MAVSLELHNTGNPSIELEIWALVEHDLSDRPGDWGVSIVGSRESDSWEMIERMVYCYLLFRLGRVLVLRCSAQFAK